MNRPPDFNSPEFQRDLYANYAALRAREAVHVSRFRGSPRFSVLRYADVWSGLRSPDLAAAGLEEETYQKLLASGNEVLVNLVRLQKGFLVVQNPPAHTRLRSLTQHAFTRRRVEALRPRIESLTHELLDGLARNGRGDLIAELAVPLPVVVIAELLGVPSRDRERFKGWSDAVAPMLDRTLQQAGLGPAMLAADAFARYFRPLVETRRADPKDDLLSALVAARDEQDSLDDDEIVGVSLFLLTAGHETTTNLLGNGVHALLSHPEQWAALRARPEAAAGAVEELLRFDSPVQRTVRHAARAFELDGVEIPRGGIVDLVLGSANRDPERFADPDTLDIERPDNRHLSFGGGIHFCLGAHLARLEGEVALRCLAERFPSLKETQEPDWKPGSLLRGPRSLPVAA